MRQRNDFRRWVPRLVLSSLLCAGVSHAGAPARDPSSYPTFHIALADDPVVTAGYALVPNDAPVLLPLAVSADAGWSAQWTDGPLLETVTLSVDGDPAGAVAAYSERRAVGAAHSELTWTPDATRELGRSHHATLAAGLVGMHQGFSPVYSTASTFEFSYLDGSSAEFLPLIDLTLSDVHETYGNAAGCCEVDADLCSGASSCFQCWDRTGGLYWNAVWTGPGLPYLSVETQPEGTPRVVEFGEICAQGTASAAGETRSFSVCHTVSEWPPVEIEGRETVYAATCSVMPAGYVALSRLFVVRGETEAEALQLLSGEPEEPAVPAAPRRKSDPERSPFVCGLGSLPVEGTSLPWLAVLALLGALGRRRLSC